MGIKRRRVRTTVGGYLTGGLNSSQYYRSLLSGVRPTASSARVHLGCASNAAGPVPLAMLSITLGIRHYLGWMLWKVLGPDLPGVRNLE